MERRSRDGQAGAFSTRSREEVYEANHPDDYIMEMPQSGEAIRGRENMRRFQEA
jgi:hypothetical protein